MCESASLLEAAASNHDGHHHHGEIKTAAEMNTGDLDVPPHQTPETFGQTPPLPSPSPAFTYYKDDFRYCYDDDSHLQDQEEEDDDDDTDQLLKDDDGADQPLEGDVPPPAGTQERASATGKLAAKLAGFARQKLAEVNMPRAAVVAGLGLVGGAVGFYFLLPAAAGVAAAGATMKAPGAAGFLISRAAFAANPQLYFQILRTGGAAVAAAAFAL